MRLTKFRRGLGIAAGYFAYYALLGLLQPYLSPLLAEWGFGHSAIGAILAAAAMCTTVAPIWLLQAGAGRVRGNRLIGGTALLALGGAGLLGAIAQAPGALALWVVALMLFSALYSPISAMLDTVAVAATTQGLWTFGSLRVAGSLGFIVASITMGRLIKGSYTQPLHLGLAVVAATLALACLSLPKETTACLDQKPAPRQKAKDAPYPKGFVFLLAALALHWFTFGPYMYGYTLLAQQIGIPSEWVGQAWSLAVISEVCFFLVADKVVGRLGYRMTLSIAFGAALLRWLLYGLFAVPAVLVAAQVLHGPSFALFYVGAMSAIRQMGSPAERPRMQGAFTGIVTGLSATLGIGFAGVAATYMPLNAAFVWVCPAQALAFALLWLPRSLRPKPLPQAEDVEPLPAA
jgi:PPP family 3-phenylpropionic acid transporter